MYRLILIASLALMPWWGDQAIAASQTEASASAPDYENGATYQETLWCSETKEPPHFDAAPGSAPPRTITKICLREKKTSKADYPKYRRIYKAEVYWDNDFKADIYHSLTYDITRDGDFTDITIYFDSNKNKSDAPSLTLQYRTDSDEYYRTHHEVTWMIGNNPAFGILPLNLSNIKIILSKGSDKMTVSHFVTLKPLNFTLCLVPRIDSILDYSKKECEYRRPNPHPTPGPGPGR